MLDIIEVKSIDYNENYRELFTTSNCLTKNEHQYIHLHSIPFDKDKHLDKKLDYLKNKEDFVLSKLIQMLRYDINLDLNAFSTSNLEKQANHFVVNSLILNVENYLENFDEILNFNSFGLSPFDLNVRECSRQALMNKKYR